MIGLLANPLVRALSAALVGAAAVWGAYAYGRSEGYEARAQEQQAADAGAYAEIIKEMENAGIDVSDPDAVLGELCRLAADANLPECGGL